MLLVYVLSTIIVLLFSLDYVLNHNEKAKLIRSIPGVAGVFIFCNALNLLVTPVELFRIGRLLAKNLDGIYGFWSFGIAVVNIYTPEDIETILSTTKYNEKSDVYNLIKPWLREGLLLSSGAKWRQRRKILTPAFHFNILKQFISRLEQNSDQLIKVLEKTGNDNVDIIPVISECTLNAICETSMGVCLPNDNRGWNYKKSIHELGKIFVERFCFVLYIWDFLFNLSPLARVQDKHLKVVHSFTRNVIKERKDYVEKNGIKILNNDENDDENDMYLVNNKKRRIAMLDLLVQAEKDGLITDEGIHEEVDTFMFEGHDTTAVGLTYLLMSLANNKSIQNKVFTELQGIFGDSTRPATMNDQSNMKYLERCIKESLRLYPPVPFISRQIEQTTKLSNFTIPGGTMCHIHIYDLHRHKNLYENPEKFDPDRFLPENSVGRHLYSYIPVSAGPRNCIGQKFAMMEMKSVVAAVLRNYELLPVTTPSDLVFKADIVLRNTGPVIVKFVKRR